MDSTVQNFASYAPIAQLTPLSNTSDHRHASVNDTTWSHGRVSAHNTPLTPAPSSIFPVPDRTIDLEYPSPTPSSSNASPPYAHSQHVDHYPTTSQFNSASMSSSNENILDQFNQIDSSIGPARVMTRRQRAQMEQKSLGRGIPLRHHLHRTENGSSPVSSSVFVLFLLNTYLGSKNPPLATQPISLFTRNVTFTHH